MALGLHAMHGPPQGQNMRQTRVCIEFVRRGLLHLSNVISAVYLADKLLLGDGECSQSQCVRGEEVVRQRGASRGEHPHSTVTPVGR